MTDKTARSYIVRNPRPGFVQCSDPNCYSAFGHPHYHASDRNASQIDAYVDGVNQAYAKQARIVPEHFTPAAAKEWLRGYDNAHTRDPRLSGAN